MKYINHIYLYLYMHKYTYIFTQMYIVLDLPYIDYVCLFSHSSFCAGICSNGDLFTVWICTGSSLSNG